ncbi:hypothetical protein FACS1894171_0090 [Clostridia bacterium]|nr:hypothetical protein FACS1894171_0090 [Clostridia bacterium]
MGYYECQDELICFKTKKEDKKHDHEIHLVIKVNCKCEEHGDKPHGDPVP